MVTPSQSLRTRMRGGPYFRFTSSAHLATGRNADYILRPTTGGSPDVDPAQQVWTRGFSMSMTDGAPDPGGSFDLDPMEQVWTHGAPTSITEATPNAEALRIRLAAWAALQEEKARRRASRGRQADARTHHRAILSFPRWHPALTDRIRPLVDAWIQTALPDDARVIAAIHWDKDHVHVHLWISALLENGDRLVFTPAQYRTMDEKWNAIYCAESGMDPRVHLESKAETRAFNRLYAIEEQAAKAAGLGPDVDARVVEARVRANYGVERPVRYRHYRTIELPEPLKPVERAASAVEQAALVERLRGFRALDADASEAAAFVLQQARAMRSTPDLWPTFERLIGPALWNPVQAIRYGSPELVPEEARYTFPYNASERLQALVDMLETRRNPVWPADHRAAERYVAALGTITTSPVDGLPGPDPDASPFSRRYMRGWTDPAQAHRSLSSLALSQGPEAAVEQVCRQPEVIGPRRPHAGTLHTESFAAAALRYLQAYHECAARSRALRERVKRSRMIRRTGEYLQTLGPSERAALARYLAQHPPLQDVLAKVEQEVKGRDRSRGRGRDSQGLGR